MAQPRFYFKNKKSILKDLSNQEIDVAIALYRQKESTEKIVLQLNIKTEIKRINLYKHLPYERSASKCSCGDTLYYKIPANTIQPRQHVQCLSCGHYEAPWCPCQACVQYRNLRREEGMKEFFTCMTEHLFPEGKVYDESFEYSKENTVTFK